MTQQQIQVKQAPKPIALMMDPKIGDPFRVVREMTVYLSPITADKHVYKQDGGLAPTATGLAILKNAAGITIIQGGNYPIASEITHPHVISWHCEMEWGNGIIRQAADYTLDLRSWIVIPGGEKLRGPRFDEMFFKRRRSIIENKSGGLLTYQSPILYIEEFFANLPTEEQVKLEKTADALAEQSIRGDRIHQVAKAQTGAMDRVLRKMLNLKSAYDQDELKRGFLVYRLEDNFERIQAGLGVENMQALMLAAAQRQFGLSGDSFSNAALALKSAEHMRLNAPAIVEEAPDLTVLMNPDSPDLVDEAAVKAAVEKIAEAPKAEPSQVLDATPKDLPAQTDVPLLAPSTAEVSAPVTDTRVAVPWRNGALVDPEAKSDGKLDADIIARTKRLITPVAHLKNHMKVHYEAKDWGGMTIRKCLRLWEKLNEIEAEEISKQELKDFPDPQPEEENAPE